MKIRPNSTDVQSDAVRIERSEVNARRNEAPGQARAEAARQRGDEARISSLGAILSQQLNPQQFLEERRAKIDLIKAQIKDGTYNPPIEDVAKALAEEISEEILSVGGIGGE